MSSSQPQHHLYSQRQVFPLSATLQVIDTPLARALSSDTPNWQIQTICEVHQKQWNIITDPGLKRRYILYGNWSNATGLCRLPIDPYLDVPSPQQLDNSLVQPLQRHAGQAPFPARDNYELWLLDRTEHLPLVLIATTTTPHKITEQTSSFWSLSRQFKIGPDSSNATTFSELRARVQSTLAMHLTTEPASQWFEIDPDTGNGSAADISQTVYHNQLDASYFPELIIRNDWGDPSTDQLFRDFINHFSPQLLTLPNISDSQRRQLEIAAQTMPTLVNRYYKAFPKFCDPKLLNKILVEAKFRNAL